MFSGQGQIPDRRYTPRVITELVRFKWRQYSLDGRKFMKNSRTRSIVSIAVLGALAGVLMFIKFPIPIAPSFYQLEFSDTAALIGGFALGPVAAVLICLIKNLINVILEGTTTAFVGEISNFIMSCALCATAAIIYKKEHTKKGAIKAMIIAVIVLALVSAVINYAVVIPAYVRFMGFPLEAIIGLGAKIFPSIDAGIDLYFYGKYFRYDRKPDAVYIYPNPETSYPGIPVEDWMEGHTVMNPSKLRAFAKYFYERGRESYRVTIKGEDLINHFKGNSNE